MWNVRIMYRAGSLKIVAEKISKYKLDLVGEQEVRREPNQQANIDFFY
jgi:hypothetical protein